MSRPSTPEERQHEREMAEGRGCFILILVWLVFTGVSATLSDCRRAAPCECAEVSP